MRTLLHRAHTGERGFTLVEVLVAATLLLVGVVGTITMVDRANGVSVGSRERVAATNLAREVIEQVPLLKYDDLTAAAVAPALRALPNLTSTTTTDWRLERRGTTFAVSATACTLDDAVDGAGDHAAGGFCAESAATGAQDLNADDMRRVTIEVRWTRDGATRLVRQSLVVPNPGNAAGPAVTGLTADRPNPLLTDLTAVVGWTAQVGGAASKVVFSLDGVPVHTDTTADDGWTWAWNTADVGDCGYTVAAQAYDTQGRSRGPLSTVYYVNRRAPAAPMGVKGGRPVRIPGVDLDWAPAEDCDVYGFRVYHTGDGSLVCDLNAGEKAPNPPQPPLWPIDIQSCSDTSAPSTGTVSYEVAAVDYDHATSAARESARTTISVSESTQPSANNQAPSSPALTHNGDGSVTLSWSPGSGLAGSDVEYYRVYRGTTGFNGRLGRTGSGLELEFIDDQRAAGTTYTYWIVAVKKTTTTGGSAYGETNPSNQVTG